MIMQLENWLKQALQLADDYERAGLNSAADAVRETLKIYVRRDER